MIVPRLARYLHRERPRSLLSMMYHANAAAAVARTIARVPTRLVLSDRANLSQILASLGPIERTIARHAVRWTYPRADAVLEVSEGVARDLLRYARVDPERVAVVYSPSIHPGLLERARETTDCHWLEEDGPPVVVAMGRLEQAKDFPTLIRAVARVRQERPVRLLILGEGSDRALLEELVGEFGLHGDAALPGFVPNPHAYIARSAVFVLSSRYEGLPNALIEAMPLGVPLIATDCESGPSEILEKGRHGRLVPVGDVTALSVAISDALDGSIRPPQPESWRRFTRDVASEAYRRVLVGDTLPEPPDGGGMP